MAKRIRSPEEFDALREASGWYAAAWRSLRGLSQGELAEELGTSKGQVSDLETGAKTRFNRDWLERFSKALNVPMGHLIDVNPFTIDEGLQSLSSIYRDLDDRDRDEVLRLAQTLSRRRASPAA